MKFLNANRKDETHTIVPGGTGFGANRPGAVIANAIGYSFSCKL